MDVFSRHTAKVLIALLIVSGVAALLFAYDLQRTLLSSRAKPTPVLSEAVKDQALEVPVIETKDHYDLIAKRNLFEFPEGTEAGVESAGVGGPETPESNLDAQLTGTVVSPDGYVMAMIEDVTQRKEDLYKVGDSIQDAEIVEILKDRVVLERAGRQETLSLFTPDKTKKGGRSRPQPADVTRPASTRPEERPDQPPTTPSPALQARIRSMMAQLRLRPHFQDGKPAGFVVGQVQAGSAFEKAGLQTGDIIVAVNDEEVITPNQLLQAYRTVAEDEVLWMDIIRNGEEGNTIEIDLEEIVPPE
jgi:general secretion pathway protein C